MKVIIRLEADSNDWHQCFAVDQLGDIVSGTAESRRRSGKRRKLQVGLNQLKPLKPLLSDQPQYSHRPQ